MRTFYLLSEPRALLSVREELGAPNVVDVLTDWSDKEIEERTVDGYTLNLADFWPGLKGEIPLTTVMRLGPEGENLAHFCGLRDLHVPLDYLPANEMTVRAFYKSVGSDFDVVEARCRS